MSKRKLGNLFKRRLSSPLARLFSFRSLPDEWARRQLKEISRFRGDLIVMQMNG
jgi:hypothetical protein